MCVLMCVVRVRKQVCILLHNAVLHCVALPCSVFVCVCVKLRPFWTPFQRSSRTGNYHTFHSLTHSTILGSLLLRNSIHVVRVCQPLPAVLEVFLCVRCESPPTLARAGDTVQVLGGSQAGAVLCGARQRVETEQLECPLPMATGGLSYSWDSQKITFAG